MSNLQRKISRKKQKQRQKDTAKKIKKQLSMFDRLPNECSSCESPFDKKSREHAMSWSVVVRSEQGIIRLFCPECKEKANKVLGEKNESIQSEQQEL